MPLVASGLAPFLAVPLAMWVLVQAVLFFRLRTRFGNVVGVCCLLFALGIANMMGPYLYARFVQPVEPTD